MSNLIITLTPEVDQYGALKGSDVTLVREDGAEITELDLLAVQAFAWGLVTGQGVTSAVFTDEDGTETEACL